MNDRHPLQLKKSKSWDPFWSYQHCQFGQFGPILRENGLDWQCCLAGSSKTAPRIFIFLIVKGAEYLPYMKSIETHARAFLPLNISAVGSVINVVLAAPYPPYYTELFWTKIFCNTNCFCMVFSFIYYILLYWLKFQYYFSSFNIKRTLISNIFSTLKIAGKILEML